MRLRRHQHGQSRLFAGSDQRGDVKNAARKRPPHRAGLPAIDPDFGGVIDALEMQPDFPAVVILRRREGRPIPIRLAAQGFGDFVGTVVFTVERLWIDFVVRQTGQHRARHRGGAPVFGFEPGLGDLEAGRRNQGSGLQLPAGINHQRIGKRPRQRGRGQ